MRRSVVGLAILAIAAVAPTLALADDQEIADQIVNTLQQHKQQGALQGFAIDLQVDHGAVWLKGHVANSQQHKLALEAARNAEGVEQVIDDLTIENAAKAESDEAPKRMSAAKNALASLGSSLQKIGQRKSANVQQAAVETPVESSNAGDEAIAREILGQLRQLKENGELRGFSIDLNVVNGDVWLKGRVATQQQQQLALNAAQRVDGVNQVINDLRVASNQLKSTPAGFERTGQPQPTRTVDAPEMLQPLSGSAQPMDMYAEGQSVVAQTAGPVRMVAATNMPLAFAPSHSVAYGAAAQGQMEQPIPAYTPGAGVGIAPAKFDHPQMPGYAWPSYAAYPNYGALTYPKQYSPTAWPYIGPFYPYPQVPLGWRKVQLEWKDGWWQLDFKSK